jgi:hypothetical protein
LFNLQKPVEAMKTIMLKSFPILLIITFVFILKGFGQTTDQKRTEKLLITGAVYDAESKEPLSNAYFSVNKNLGYTTNDMGRFLTKGNPGDTITYSYLGYADVKVLIPDTLAALEYLLGIFMTKDTIMIPEIVIFPRSYLYPSIITNVKVDQEMINNAQANVDRAVVQSLTQPVKAYDADMNAKQTMRTYEMRAQYKGLLVTPENSVGVSTSYSRTYNLIYGAPIISSKRTVDEMITQSEEEILIGQYLAGKRDASEKKQK